MCASDSNPRLEGILLNSTTPVSGVRIPPPATAAACDQNLTAMDMDCDGTIVAQQECRKQYRECSIEAFVGYVPSWQFPVLRI